MCCGSCFNVRRRDGNVRGEQQYHAEGATVTCGGSYSNVRKRGGNVGARGGRRQRRERHVLPRVWCGAELTQIEGTETACGAGAELTKIVKDQRAKGLAQEQ
eukprot:238253-Rhodomonas_salina.1